jgi:plasmid stabilization system protein ParE
VARIEIAPEVGDDFDRIFDHLTQSDVERTHDRIGEIIQALNVLEANPLIGRPAAGGLRELILGRGSRGCVALYRDVAELDAVFVLAVRGQGEAGYRRE